MLDGCDTEDNGVPTVVGFPNNAPTWYNFDWMATALYAPLFRVLDTESSLGPYATQSKTFTPSDGLVAAAYAISVRLKQLYPEDIIDRTGSGSLRSPGSPHITDLSPLLLISVMVI